MIDLKDIFKLIGENENGFFTQLDPTNYFKQKHNAVSHHQQMLLKQKQQEESFWQQKDTRKLSELISIYCKMHGQTLKDYKKRRAVLSQVCTRLNDPVASLLTGNTFANYRSLRIEEVSTSTANREHSYLRALYNELRRLGVIDYENPVSDIRQFKEKQTNLRYLSHSEIKSLLSACTYSKNHSLSYIVKICLATGARWSEANTLKVDQIKDNKITFTDTKNGKNRSVPIDDRLMNELQFIIDKKLRGFMFDSAVDAFKYAVERAGIELPDGQMTHVLRHTFASHFVMNGGNIIVLKDILGHKEISTTMRYAHLAPEYLSDAVQLNPLNQHWVKKLE